MAVSAKKKTWPPDLERIRGVAIHLDIWAPEICMESRPNGNADGNLVYLYAETPNRL